MLGCCCPVVNIFQDNYFLKNMSFRNKSRFSNSMDPDNAQYFSLSLASAVDKVYQVYLKQANI